MVEARGAAFDPDLEERIAELEATTVRKGNRKVPILRGGGMAFAKKPRDYGYHMPKKARRAALEAAIPDNRAEYRGFSRPTFLANNIIWRNRAFYQKNIK